LTGSSPVAAGTEVQIYSIQLEDAVAGAPFNTVNLGTRALGGINIQISDLTAPTGLATADSTQLNFYRDTDGTFNSVGETFMVSAVVASVSGGNTLLDVTGLGLGDDCLIPNGGVYFVITAVIAADATGSHTFRVGTDNNHVGFTESIFGNFQDGAPGIVAADGNHIVIAAETASFSSGVAGGGRGIPFGGEPVMLALLVGTGLYMIRRTSA